MEQAALLRDDGSPNVSDVEGGLRSAVDDETCPAVLDLEQAFHRIGYGWQQIRVLVICGLCFCTDSIEVGLLSFLQAEAKVDFHLSTTEESLLTSIVFAGELTGALIFGPMADRYGRKAATFASAALVAIAGVASAFAPNFEVLVALRAFVGLGIGGMAVPFDILAEFMPSEYRGKALMGIEFFWTFGTLFVNGLAWAMLSAEGWRLLVGLCSVPVVLAMLSFPFMPESPHWLLTVGRSEDAVVVLRRAGELNGRPGAIGPNTRIVLHHETTPSIKYSLSSSPPSAKKYSRTDGDGTSDSDSDEERERRAQVTIQDDAQSVGSLKEEAAHNSMSVRALFQAKYLRTTLLLFTTWFSTGLTYYGTVLIAPEFFSQSDDPTDFNYPSLFITSLAELFSCTLAFFLIDRVGRKALSGWAYLTCGVFTAILMGAKHMPKGLGIVLLMVARGSIFIGTSTTWVVTPELYPTTVRAAGHSWCNALARVGAFATPYWGNTEAVPFELRLLFYAVFDVVAAVASFSFPKETAGKALMDD
ncbi:uncharacterized protein MONBRDRAFT_33459 [Monosiga brevicollis MX1]|uniref:Major facilitator superfamily (MFS) profile domain-containing protein n=1 Tax=Monosiga brevicollis TaxID=81824 RepID=A9V5I0_MONBE|nr:uncharacterized protein MONBRDRAFT_33459 [Monosiga brevicollis MX1]EDQ87287.1 predicted protein [Monosiga brevicollis MX1]|eukprot:XP_001747900.1 hypothetical protein [Monosiga brevicollis MX1]